MPPQPLSRVRSNVDLPPFPYPHEPPAKFVEAIVQVLSIWAQCEMMLSHIVARFLKADFDIVNAMFQAIVSGEGRRDALLAAAAKALDTKDFNLLRAVLKAIKPVRDRRNEFAHHMWTNSPAVPEALLLVDPQAMHQFIASTNKAMVEKKLLYGTPEELGLPDGKYFDDSKVFVYRERDFEEVVDATRQAAEWIANLYMVVGEPPPALSRDTMRDALLRQPLIRQHFERFSREDNPQLPA